jgi:hypothetical protein
MMTLDRCVELLKELQALERLALAIASRGLDTDWDYLLLLASDRAFWVRNVLQREDPELLRVARGVLRDEALSIAGNVSESTTNSETRRLYEKKQLRNAVKSAMTMPSEPSQAMVLPLTRMIH